MIQASWYHHTTTTSSTIIHSYIHKETSLIRSSTKFKKFIIFLKTLAKQVFPRNPIPYISKIGSNPFYTSMSHPNGTFDIPVTLMNSIKISLPTIKRERKNFSIYAKRTFTAPSAPRKRFRSCVIGRQFDRIKWCG